MAITGWLIWDFDGTLAELPGMWSGTLAHVVERELGRPHSTAAMFRPWLQSGFPWHTPHVVRKPPTIDADEWWDALSPVLTNAMVRGAAVTPTVARRLLPAIRTAYCEPSRWRLFDDTTDALSRLAAQGWRHLLLSNHVPELRLIVSRLGLATYFESIYCSAETGVEKPNPAAFENAVRGLSRRLPRVMIGDSYEADILGARQIGLDAVLVRRPYEGERCFVAGLVDLAAALNLIRQQPHIEATHASQR